MQKSSALKTSVVGCPPKKGLTDIIYDTAIGVVQIQPK